MGFFFHADRRPSLPRTHPESARLGEGGGERDVLPGALDVAVVARLVNVEPFSVEPSCD